MIAVFLFSVAFCAYTTFGYPLLLGLLARWRERPVRKAPWRATVSVILPVFNGERWMAAKLESIRALDYPAELLEILVVSDGSTDGTETIVQRFASRSKLAYLALPRSGKAAALNAALAKASGEILFFTDVRQQLDPGSLANLVACFADPQVGAASSIPGAAGIAVAGAGGELYPEAFGEVIGPAYPQARTLCEIVAAQLADLDPDPAAARPPLLTAKPLYLRRPDAREPGPPKRVTPS